MKRKLKKLSPRQKEAVSLLKEGWFINHLTDTAVHPHYEVKLLRVRGKEGRPISKLTFQGLLKRGLLTGEIRHTFILCNETSYCTEYRLKQGL